MAKLVLSLVCLALIEASLALKCKTCNVNDVACKNLEDMTCPGSPGGMEPACLTYVYKEDKDAKEEIIQKKCVNKEKDGKYPCIHTSKQVVITCETCTDDFCNEKSGASKVAVGSLAVVSIVIALFTRTFL